MFREAIALEKGFALYREYTEDEASKYIQVAAITLKRLRLAGKIGFLRKGERKIAYMGFQIADFLYDSVEWPDTLKENIRSEIGGFPNAREAQRGIAPATTPTMDAQNVTRLAQQTFQRPKKPS